MKKARIWLTQHALLEGCIQISHLLRSLQQRWPELTFDFQGEKSV